MKTMAETLRRVHLLLLLMLCAAATHGHGTEQHGTAPPRGDYTRTLADYNVPDIALVAADGGTTSLLTELRNDKPIMLNFIFTSCNTICPVLSATFTQVRDQLGHEARTLRIISISIDPEHDTPQRLQAYARKYRAGPEWRFLTGDITDILLLQRIFNVYRGAKMNHASVTFLRAAHADSWIRLEGLTSADDLLREYRSLPSP